MEKCVSCHGEDGSLMTPWKFHDRGHERFEDIITHSPFIHNDINKKSKVKVLKNYNLSSDSLKIKLSHIDGFDLRFFLRKEFEYEDSVTKWLKYFGILIVLLFGYSLFKSNQKKKQLLAKAKSLGFSSIKEYEKHLAYEALKKKATEAGFDSVEAYQAYEKEQARKRLEAEAKRNGFDSVEAYQKHKEEERRKKQEEKKQKFAQQKAEEEAEKPTITSVVLVNHTVKVRGMYLGKEKELNAITCNAKSVQGWSSDTFTVINNQGYYKVYTMIPNSNGIGRKWSYVTFKRTSKTFIR